MERVANYCPRCGTKLVIQVRHDAERPVCPACDYVVYFDPKVAVLAFIVRQERQSADERVLLVQRANDPGMGKWACPAGFVDYNEPPEDAVRREVLEETGLTVVVDALLQVFPKQDGGLADIVIAYAASVTGGTLRAADDAQDAGWFTRGALPELVFYPSRHLVGDVWRRNGSR